MSFTNPPLYILTLDIPKALQKRVVPLFGNFFKGTEISSTKELLNSEDDKGV